MTTGHFEFDVNHQWSLSESDIIPILQALATQSAWGNALSFVCGGLSDTEKGSLERFYYDIEEDLENYSDAIRDAAIAKERKLISYRQTKKILNELRADLSDEVKEKAKAMQDVDIETIKKLAEIARSLA